MLLWILLSVIIVSLISLVGIFFISLKDKILEKILMMLIALASGAMLGGAFLHLMPEAVESGMKNIWTYLIVGILVFFVLEKFLHWRHCHKGKCKVHSFAYLNLVGDSIHNFIDGLIIAAAYIMSFETGIAVTFAVVVHEIPQEIGDFGVLVYGGFKKYRALFYNFLTALLAVAGALIGYLLRGSFNTAYLIPFAAGGFIYIAASDLIPELKKTMEIKKAAAEFAFLVLGIVLMLLLKVFFR
ncbi:ZIP family metal transporter [Candidatus Woesearchaeota archaeon]|nr:ZIP family metal transporter [Candidatus Woesearchaeota archaeon]